MLARRTMMLGLTSLPALAADWRTDYPTIRLAIVPSENEDGLLHRWAPMIDFLSRELRVKLVMRPATDYAAVIEAQRAGQVHIGYYGAASFARALMTGVKIGAFACNVSPISGRGYYSVFFVRADSPYQTIADLRGKNIGFVDPNSTSGYQVPLFTLDKLHINPETFFSRTLLAGSHENAIIALANGTVDVAANSWTSEAYSNLQRMLNKGMLKNRNGSPMLATDFRIILKSPLIPNGPYAYLDALPEAMKADIRNAFFAAPVRAKAAFDALSDGNNSPWEPIDNKAYDDIIALVRFVDGLRKL